LLLFSSTASRARARVASRKALFEEQSAGE